MPRKKEVDVPGEVHVIETCLADMEALSAALVSLNTRIERMSQAELREQAPHFEVTQQSNQKRFNRQETQLEKSLKKISRADPRTTAKHSTRKSAIVDAYRGATRAFASLGVTGAAAAANESRLFTGARAAEAVDASAGNNAVLGATAAITARTLKVTEEGISRLEETKAQIQAAATTVEEDNRRMAEADAKLAEIDTEADLAGKVVVNMLKRVYTDKILLAFTVVIMLAIVGIVIYSAVVPDNDFNVPDVATPPTPECVEKIAAGGSC